MQSNNEIIKTNMTSFYEKLSFAEANSVPEKLNDLQVELNSIQREYLDTNKPHLIEKYQETLEQLFPCLEPFYLEVVPILTDLLFRTAMEFYHDNDIKIYDKILMIQTLMQDVSDLCEQLDWPLIEFNPSINFQENKIISNDTLAKIKNTIDFFNILIYPLQVHADMISSLPKGEGDRYKKKTKAIAEKFYTCYQEITRHENSNREQAIIVFHQIFESLDKMDLLSINTSLQSLNNNISLEENLKKALEQCNSYKTKCFQLLENLNQLDPYYQGVKRTLYHTYHDAMRIEYECHPGESNSLTQDEGTGLSNFAIDEEVSANENVKTQIGGKQINRTSTSPSLAIIDESADKIDAKEVCIANENESDIECFETVPTNHIVSIPVSASELKNPQEEADTSDTEATEDKFSVAPEDLSEESETEASKVIREYYEKEVREDNCAVFFKEAYQCWNNINNANCVVIDEQFTQVEDQIEDLQKLIDAIQRILQKFSNMQVKEEAKTSSPTSPKKRKAASNNSGSPSKKFHIDTTQEGGFGNIKIKPKTLFFTDHQQNGTHLNSDSVTPASTNLPISPSF